MCGTFQIRSSLAAKSRTRFHTVNLQFAPKRDFRELAAVVPSLQKKKKQLKDTK